MRAAWFLVGSLLGCSSSEGPGGPPVNGPDAIAACAEYGASYCSRLGACVPASLGQRFGDQATCAARVARGCEVRLLLTGNGKTPLDVTHCARALGAGTCNALRGDLVPTDCLPSKGLLPAGTACFDDSQCASAYCPGGSGLCGGRCKDAGIAGSSCADTTSCGRALVCTDGKCARPVPSVLDDLCAGPDTCDAGLACQGGLCQKPAASGQPCDRTWATAPDCNVDAGLVCAAGKCAPLVLGAPGSACDTSFSGPRQCAKGECFEGKCRAWVDDGGECLGTAQCLSPARCDRGVCKMFDQVTTACGK